jgi:hypothetical protein
VLERKLVGRNVVRAEPPELGDVVGRLGCPFTQTRRVVDVQRRDVAAPVLVAIHPDPEQLLVGEADPRFLPELAPDTVEWMLALLEKAAREIPLAGRRIVGALAEENPAFLVDDEGRGSWCGVGKRDEPALRTLEPAVLRLDRRGAHGAVLPVVELAHAATIGTAMPRHVPASVTELSRIGLLAALPGELLLKLASRMRREEIGPGAPVVTEGEDGERFYVVLNGLLSVVQNERGIRGVLKPGDYFGEVALAMGIPRTASVSPMTAVTLASCDRETFDEFIRPLFAE